MAGIMAGLAIMGTVLSHPTVKGAVGSMVAGNKPDVSKSDVSTIAKDLVRSNKTKLALSGGSMLKVLGSYIVQPVIVVSDDLKHSEVIEKLLTLHVDMFAGFYLQIFQILKTQYGLSSVDIVSVLGTGGKNLMRDMIGNESSSDHYQEFLDDSIDLSIGNESNKVSLADSKVELSIPNVLMRTVDITTTTTLANGGELTITLPITIKATIKFVKTQAIAEVLDVKGEDFSLKAALEDYRSSARGLSDLVFASDLIAKYKKAKLGQSSDLLDVVEANTLSANKKVISKGMVGYEKYYIMYILSDTDKVRIENTLRGKLAKHRTKEEFLTQAGGLSVTLVDEDRERITIGLKDLHGNSDMSFKALSKKKDKSGDIDEIIKALLVSKSPVF